MSDRTNEQRSLIVANTLAQIRTNHESQSVYGSFSQADIGELLAEIARLQADSERYKWLADRVLYSDYGDNDHPSRTVGWGICKTLRDGNQFMFGDSIDMAIDVARRGDVY